MAPFSVRTSRRKRPRCDVKNTLLCIRGVGGEGERGRGEGEGDSSSSHDMSPVQSGMTKQIRETQGAQKYVLDTRLEVTRSPDFLLGE